MTRPNVLLPQNLSWQPHPQLTAPWEILSVSRTVLGKTLRVGQSFPAIDLRFLVDASSPRDLLERNDDANLYTLYVSSGLATFLQCEKRVLLGWLAEL